AEGRAPPRSLARSSEGRRSPHGWRTRVAARTSYRTGCWAWSGRRRVAACGLLSDLVTRAPDEPLIEAAADRIIERPRVRRLHEGQQPQGAHGDRQDHEHEKQKKDVQHGHTQPKALAK